MKRKIVLTISLVLALTVLGTLWYKMPVKFVSLNPDEVSEIYVFSGTNGKELHITEKDEIAHIINNFSSIKLQKNGISMFLKGYRLNLTIYLKDGSAAPGMNDFIINGSTIRKDPFFYKIAEGDLDYPYIEDLVEKHAQNPNRNDSPTATENTEMVQTEAPTEPALPKSATWQEAYLHIICHLQDYLADEYGNREIQDTDDPNGILGHLGIHDFDGDGTPELVAGDLRSMAVFTFSDGQAQKLTDLYYPDEIWGVNGVQFRDNSISITCSGSDGSDFVQFGYLDGEYMLGIYSEYRGCPDVFINGELSTLEEMNRIYPLDWNERADSELRERIRLVHQEGEWILKFCFSEQEATLDSTFDFDLIKWE